MQFQQIVKNHINNQLFINVINIFCKFYFYFYNIYLYIFDFVNYKNKNKIQEDVYLFLKEISIKFKNNNIDNIDLLCDILYIHNKYMLNCGNNIKKNLDEDMKYYILGWYIYQNLNNKL